jgi:hypothetical protein
LARLGARAGYAAQGPCAPCRAGPGPAPCPAPVPGAGEIPPGPDDEFKIQRGRPPCILNSNQLFISNQLFYFSNQIKSASLETIMIVAAICLTFCVFHLVCLPLSLI